MDKIDIRKQTVKKTNTSSLLDYTNISSSIMSQLLEIPETEVRIMLINVARQNLITLDVDMLVLSSDEIEILFKLLNKCSTPNFKSIR